MSTGDFSSILASSLSGSQIQERQDKGSAESTERMSVAHRIRESRFRAEKAAGVGTVENETQGTFGDRDSGRVSYFRTVSTEGSSLKKSTPPRDLSGALGTRLDIFG